MAEKTGAQYSDTQPEVPEYQHFDTASLLQPWNSFYQPQSSSDYMDLYGQMMSRYPTDYNTVMGLQTAWAPYLQSLEQQASVGMSQALFNESQRQAPISAATQYGLDAQYSPLYAGIYRNSTQAGAPEYMDAYKLMGANVNQGLSDGYALGDALSNEVEQSIRGGQMARGNWLGPAPTAQEAMGTGQAAIDLYNQRMAAGQNYLNGSNPIAVGSAVKGGQATSMIYPSQSYVDPSLASNQVSNVANTAQGVFSSVGAEQGNYNSALASSQGNYNTSQLSAYDMNNKYMFEQYENTADAWGYNQAVANGLYSTPNVGSGTGQMVGSIVGGVGAAAGGIATAAGAVAAGGATAAAGGAAAAGSAAAAALCWLARKLIPDKWKSFRKWLFTMAPDEVRLDYIYNARRLANALT